MNKIVEVVETVINWMDTYKPDTGNYKRGG